MSLRAVTLPLLLSLTVAYAIPPGALLSEYRQNRQRIAGLDAELALDGTSGARLRVALRNPEMLSVAPVGSGEGLPAGALPALEAALALLLPGRVETTLARLGIDREVVAYGRLEGEVCYILGARAVDPEQPQAWFEKEARRLVEVRYRSEGHTVRVVMDRYDEPAAQFVFPGRIRIVVDGAPAAAFTLASLTPLI